MSGEQRKPFVQKYWGNPDPHFRFGPYADTFAEFEARVLTFMDDMDNLTDGTVVFGHGIWLGLFHWLLAGNRARDTEEMRAFRAFQLALPMPNCAIFTLTDLLLGLQSGEQVSP